MIDFKAFSGYDIQKFEDIMQGTLGLAVMSYTQHDTPLPPELAEISEIVTLATRVNQTCFNEVLPGEGVLFIAKRCVIVPVVQGQKDQPLDVGVICIHRSSVTPHLAVQFFSFRDQDTRPALACEVTLLTSLLKHEPTAFPYTTDPDPRTFHWTDIKVVREKAKEDSNWEVSDSQGVYLGPPLRAPTPPVKKDNKKCIIC